MNVKYHKRIFLEYEWQHSKNKAYKKYVFISYEHNNFILTIWTKYLIMFFSTTYNKLIATRT